jgi:hypothetical protein
MSVDPVHTITSERIEAAKRAQKAREDGIRAKGMQEGRAKERDEICREVGVATIEEIKVLPQVLADVDNRWAREERKHGAARFWRGVAFGAVGGAAFTSVGYLMVVGAAMDRAFEQAREYTANLMAMRMVQQTVSDEPVHEPPPSPRQPADAP